VIRQQDEAFVIDTHALGDADLIVTLFAAEHGKVRAVARAGRSSRRRFGGLLEPLTRVRAAWTGRDGAELQRLEELEEVRSFAAMQAEPRRQAACAVLAEVTGSFAREGEADADEFRLLGAVLEALERGVEPASLLRYFEYWTLRIHGLLPDLARCACCRRALPESGPSRVVSGRGALCRDCPGEAGERESRLTAADRAFLDAARRLPPAELPVAASARGPAIELLLRGPLEAFAERTFRSYRHFKALAASGEGVGP
jgi:DNA repair protein RecO (recombination protein O)